MSDPINNASGPNPGNDHSYAVGPLIEVASPTFAWFGDGSKSTSGAGISFGIGGRFEWDQHIFKVGYSHTNINLDGPLFLDKKSTSVESKGARFQYGYSFNRFFGCNIFFETGKLVYGQSSDQI